MLFVRPPQAARGARGIQRGRGPAGAAGRLTRADAPADRLAGWPPKLGSGSSARPGPRWQHSTTDLAGSGEIANARAAICLAEGNPAAALAAVQDVLNGIAPAIGYVTVIEANLLAALAHRELGDQRAAIAAAECALALAEADRLVLPFAMTGSLELLDAMPRHETAHAALLADILDVMRGSSISPGDESSLAEIEQLSPSELRVLRYLPTNLSRPEIASELSVSVNTVNTHIRNIYAKLQAQDRSSAVRRAREMRLLSAGPTRG